MWPSAFLSLFSSLLRLRVRWQGDLSLVNFYPSLDYFRWACAIEDEDSVILSGGEDGEENLSCK